MHTRQTAAQYRKLHIFGERQIAQGFPGGSVVKNPPINAGDAREGGSIPRSESSPGVGNGNLLQYSCLGNSTGRRTWQATVHGVAKSQTQQSLNTHTHKHSEFEGNPIIENTKARMEDREHWGEIWVQWVKKASGSRNSTCRGHVLSTGGLGSEPWQEQSGREEA